ncbi:MAG: phosphopantothenoylcysteine decarboxylase [Planctomycetota bacterium]|nr:phosphopantothenoylcysteine decarboxylase [Planctomycetota bacterium]
MNPPVLLITAGPTREPIDDLRYLSNGASGTLGIEVACAARDAGWEVHLALGPVPHPELPGIHLHPFVTALDLEKIAIQLWPEVDALVATAAVCDYRPAQKIDGKRKKSAGDWNLRLVRNPDVLAGRAAEKGDRVLIGFALEATEDRQEALRKAVNKRLDLVLCNTLGNLGEAIGDYIWLEPAGHSISLPEISKVDLARKLVEFIGTKVASRRSDRAFNGE